MPPLRLDTGLMEIFKKFQSPEEQCDALQEYTPKKGFVVKCSKATLQEMKGLIQKGGRERSCVLIALAKCLDAPAHRYGLSAHISDLLGTLEELITERHEALDQDGQLILDVCKAAWGQPANACKIIKALLQIIVGFADSIFSYRHSMKAAQLANDLVESADKTTRKALLAGIKVNVLRAPLLRVPDLGDFDLQLEFLQLVFACTAPKTRAWLFEASGNGPEAQGLIKALQGVRLSHFEEDCTRSLVSINNATRTIISKEVCDLHLNGKRTAWFPSTLDPTLPRLMHFNLGSNTVSFQLADESEPNTNATMAIDAVHVLSYTVSKDTLAIVLDKKKAPYHKFDELKVDFTDGLMIQHAASCTLGPQKQLIPQTRASVTTPIRIIRPTYQPTPSQAPATPREGGRAQVSSSVTSSKQVQHPNQTQAQRQRRQKTAPPKRPAEESDSDADFAAVSQAAIAAVEAVERKQHPKTTKPLSHAQMDLRRGSRSDRQQQRCNPQAAAVASKDKKAAEGRTRPSSVKDEAAAGTRRRPVERMKRQKQQQQQQQPQKEEEKEPPTKREKRGKSTVASRKAAPPRNSGRQEEEQGEEEEEEEEEEKEEEEEEEERGSISETDISMASKKVEAKQKKEQRRSQDEKGPRKEGEEHAGDKEESGAEDEDDEDWQWHAQGRQVQAAAQGRQTRNTSARKRSRHTAKHDTRKVKGKTQEQVKDQGKRGAERKYCDHTHAESDQSNGHSDDEVHEEEEVEKSNRRKTRSKRAHSSKSTATTTTTMTAGRRSNKSKRAQADGSKGGSVDAETKAALLAQQKRMEELERLLLSKQSELKNMASAVQSKRKVPWEGTTPTTAAAATGVSEPATPRFRPLSIISTPKSASVKAATVLFPEETEEVEPTADTSVEEELGESTNDGFDLTRMLPKAKAAASTSQRSGVAGEKAAQHPASTSLASTTEARLSRNQRQHLGPQPHPHPQPKQLPQQQQQQEQQQQQQQHQHQNVQFANTAPSLSAPSSFTATGAINAQDGGPWDAVYSTVDSFEGDLQAALVGFGTRLKALHKSSRSANGSMTARLKNLKRKQAKLATLIKGNKVILTQAAKVVAKKGDALENAKDEARATVLRQQEHLQATVSNQFAAMSKALVEDLTQQRQSRAQHKKRQALMQYLMMSS